MVRVVQGEEGSRPRSSRDGTRLGARRPTRDDVLGRDERARSPEGGRGCPKRGSQAERDARKAHGRSRGGFGTKPA